LAWSESTGLIVADPHQKTVYSVNAEGKVTALFPVP
jgi:hypothetical protein